MLNDTRIIVECCLSALEHVCVAKRNLHLLHWRAKGEEFSIYHELSTDWIEVLQTVTDELVEVTDGADMFVSFTDAVQNSLQNYLCVCDEKHIDARRVLQNVCHAIEEADLQITCACVEIDAIKDTTVPQSLKAGLDAISEKLGNLCYQLKRSSAI
jgi:DNA-binding ferritin-like protein